MTAVAVETTAPRTASAYRLGFLRVLRGEFIKLLTLRSTWWSLSITVALALAISALAAFATRDFPGSPAVLSIVAPIQFTMLVAGILGAISVTGEYSTGMIRSSLAAEPRRGVVLLAKSLAVAALLAATAVVTTVLSVVATSLVGGAELDWADPVATWIPLTWGVIAMAVFALIGVGFGFLIRNGGGAISATVGVLFVLPIVFSLFTIGGESWQWLVDASRFLPSSATMALTMPEGVEWEPVTTLLAWPAVLLLGGWAVLRTRDA